MVVEEEEMETKKEEAVLAVGSVGAEKMSKARTW